MLRVSCAYWNARADAAGAEHTDQVASLSQIYDSERAPPHHSTSVLIAPRRDAR
jgi:hypothetical protein